MTDDLGMDDLEQAVKDKITEKKKQYSVEDVCDLPDVPDNDEIGCFVNVEKMVAEDKKQMFTFRVTVHGVTIHHEILKALPDTQPTLDFQDEELEPWDEVLESLKVLFKRYVYFRSPTIYIVVALVAMSTYFREVFSTYPYMDYVAIEVNCGKTTALQATCWASFYGFVTIGPTPAVIYRVIDQCKGVLGIDEIDNALTNREQRGAITGILNAGYKKGIFAQRCAPRTNEVENYDPFGAKGFSRVKWLPRSIVDRSIQIPMMRASEHIKLEDLDTSDSFREVRDALYNLRLHSSDQVREMASWTRNNCGLIGRDREIFMAPLTIAKLVGDAVYDEALEWAKDYIVQKRSQADDPRMVVLVEVLLSYLGQREVASTDIRDGYYALLEERDMMGADEKRARSINKYLIKMDLRRSDKKTDNKTYFDIDKEITLRWAKYYGFSLTEAQLEELDKLVLGIDTASDLRFYINKEKSTEAGCVVLTNSSNLSNCPTDESDKHKKASRSTKKPTKSKKLDKSTQKSNLSNSFEQTKKLSNSEAEKSDLSNSKKRPLPRVVKKFDRWLAQLPHAGQRGFKESDIKKVHGEGHLEQLSKYVKKGWIEQRADSKMWWLSDTGKTSLTPSSGRDRR